MLARNCQAKDCGHCGGQRKFADVDNNDVCFPCDCECHWEKTTFFVPGQNALGYLLRNFQTAGANITGLTIDFEGLRGDPQVRTAMIKYMIAAGWTRKINGVFFEGAR
jgi:hypothetical protein